MESERMTTLLKTKKIRVFFTRIILCMIQARGLLAPDSVIAFLLDLSLLVSKDSTQATKVGGRLVM